MLLLIDNYDSFVYNLYAYFQELGQEIIIKKNDEITLLEISKMPLKGIILSPGPGHPSNTKLCTQLIDYFKDKIPILGVCLGHQLIGYYFKEEVRKGITPVHGKVSLVSHDNSQLFLGLPDKIRVMRYHSLEVSIKNEESELSINAISEDGTVMAISHKKYPVFGVQFHPESILSEYGYEILVNFTNICSNWSERKKHENN